MVSELNPYLFFDGTCEEALNFYKDALNGEITMLRKVSEAPKEQQQPQHLDKIMHAVLSLGKVSLFASDSMGYPASNGSNTSVSLTFDSQDSIDRSWEKMKQGGKVNMELQDTFWGARFGMLKDKYGINWIFNYDKK